MAMQVMTMMPNCPFSNVGLFQFNPNIGFTINDITSSVLNKSPKIIKFEKHDMSNLKLAAMLCLLPINHYKGRYNSN